VNKDALHDDTQTPQGEQDTSRAPIHLEGGVLPLKACKLNDVARRHLARTGIGYAGIRTLHLRCIVG